MSRIIIMFPGQGSQRMGMGKKYFKKYRAIMSKANDICGFSIEELCINGPIEKLNNTQFSQPAIYMVNTLAYLDQTNDDIKKRKNNIFIGHSLGEINALQNAGAFDLLTGLKIVKERGDAMSLVKNGGMLVIIGLQLEQINKIIENNFEKLAYIANINTREQIVISCHETVMNDIEILMKKEGAKTVIKLNTNGPFHSPLMEKAKVIFENKLNQITINNINYDVIGNITGREYENDKIKEYLVNHLVCKVQWYSSIKYLISQGYKQFIEVNESKLLTNMLESIKKTDTIYPFNKSELKKEDKPESINKNYSSDQCNGDEILIIGLSCRFPEACDEKEFWNNLMTSKSSIKEIPKERFEASTLYEREIIKSKWLGSIDGVDNFDNNFFNISKTDAKKMDPQQRILLEEAWHCIEDASISLNILQQYNTSVYTGGMAFDYLLRFINTDNTEIDAKTCINNYACGLANRISYHLNLTGESYSSDAACASSFVALKQAFDALRQKKCDFSIVGAVNILSHPLRYIDFSKSRMLSKDGICKTFDASANGYVQGEGAGVLLLTTYKMAKKIKARIYAVLNSIELSHNGQNSSITAPSKQAQVRLLRKTLEAANLKPQDISYIETHGTATPLGDPIEVNAIKEVFGNAEQLYIGSVKSNIGHLEGAAGFAGIIKVILMMKHNIIPPSINYQRENPLLEISDSNIKVANKLITWMKGPKIAIKRAGVSSFGFGGANGHCILEEPIQIENTISESSKRSQQEVVPFALSAQSIDVLKLLIQKWYMHLKIWEESDINNVCLNLLFGRTPLKYRYITKFINKNDLLEKLNHAVHNYQPILHSQKKFALYFDNISKTTLTYIKHLFQSGINLDVIIPKNNNILNDFLSKIKELCQSSTNIQIFDIWYENEIFYPAYFSSENIKKIVFPLLKKSKFDFFSEKIELLLSVNKYFKDEFDRCQELLRKKNSNDKKVTYLLAGIHAMQAIELHFQTDLINKDINIFFLKKIISLCEKNIEHIFDIIVNDINLDININAKYLYFFERDKCLFTMRPLTNIKNDNKSIKSLQTLIPEALIFVCGTLELNADGKNIFCINNKQDILFTCIHLWQQGCAIDWNLFFSDFLYIRKDLIAYPFEKISHWKLLENLPNKKNEKSEDMTFAVKVDNFSIELLDILELKNEIHDIHNFSLFELGIDSITILKVHNEISKKYGNIPISVFYESKNLNELIGKLKKNLKLDPDYENSISLKSNIMKSNIDDIDDKEIYVIGMAGRFPDANNIFQFWENLKNGKDSVSTVPTERWSRTLKENIVEIFNKKYKDPLSGSFLTDIDKFDADFFGIAPKDAVFMDPQERIFLEIAQDCLEHSGINRSILKALKDQNRRFGVIVGSTYNNYQLILSELNKENTLPINSQTYSIANRVSYFFDLTGPSLVVDTACSSSLYALHLALHSIQSGECDLAIVGGTNLTLHPSKYDMLIKHGYLSAKGHCNAFGADGDGYVPAEAVGAVILCRGNLASEFGFNKLAKISGSGVSHGGKTNGYTVPDPSAQANCIENALNDAKWFGNDISYIETHGTGTLLGDPIEIEGLAKVFKDKFKNNQCYIGSVKSNIGHAEAASGIVQLIKVVLQLQHKMLVPSLLFSSTYNPFINFDSLPFSVNRSMQPWQTIQNLNTDLNQRRAGISSFGAGGTNVHVLVEEEVIKPYVEQSNRDQLILISARNQDCLKKDILILINYIKLNNPNLQQLALGLLKKDPYKARLSCVVNHIDELVNILDRWCNGVISKKLYIGAEILNCHDDTDTDLITFLIEKKYYEQAAKLWSIGFNINYTILPYQNNSILNLPPRNFIKKRHWPCEEYLPTSIKENNLISALANNIDVNVCNLDVATFQDKTPLNLIEFIQSIVGKVLGYSLEEINVDRGFFDLGMESLMVMELVRALNKSLNIVLEDVDIFNYPTCEKLNQHILQLLNVDISAPTLRANSFENENNEIDVDLFIQETETLIQGAM